MVLPGVGAFANGMAATAAPGLAMTLHGKSPPEARPLLGICLGMQMLLETSEEFGITSGLGLIPGRVVRCRPQQPATAIRIRFRISAGMH